jgi:dihydroorotate dehydrogenase
VSAWRLPAYRAIRPLLFRVDPERIHRLALDALAVAGRSAPGRMLCAIASGISDADASRTPLELMGLRFRNRIGLGAGFDKDGVAIRGWAALGFGFVELGTVTPRPQPGNPRPRLFRLPPDAALINRMGFNNAGADALAARIREARPHLPSGFVVGANIGRNRNTSDEAAIDDFTAAAEALAGVADYLAVNVSSPNTPGLRALQEPARLAAIVEAVHRTAPDVPILVKLSPDLPAAEADQLVRTLAASSASGVILSNTSTERAGLKADLASEPGGLSGRPLLPRTIASVTRARRIASDRFAIVASGGIGWDEEGPLCLLDERADLVELWSALIFDGPGLIGELIRRASRP